MARTVVITAALLAFAGVALGALGTHGLAAILETNGREGTFRTANQYHLIHALALIGVAWAGTLWPGKFVRWAAYLFLAGIVLFSGSLYLLAIFNLSFMGAVAPLGGAAFLVGWLCLAAAAWRGR